MRLRVSTSRDPVRSMQSDGMMDEKIGRKIEETDFYGVFFSFQLRLREQRKSFYLYR